MSRPIAIVLAGGLAAGKSTLARELEKQGVAARVLAFGQYVRDEASRRGQPVDRGRLQELGGELVSSPTRFVAAFLKWAGPDIDSLPVVIEGLRHAEVGLELRTRMPGHDVMIVYLDVPTEVRRARYVDRGGSPGDFDRFDESPVEAGRHDVRTMADLVVQGLEPPEEVASRVLAEVEESRGRF